MISHHPHTHTQLYHYLTLSIRPMHNNSTYMQRRRNFSSRFFSSERHQGNWLHRKQSASKMYVYVCIEVVQQGKIKKMSSEALQDWKRLGLSWDAMQQICSCMCAWWRITDWSCWFTHYHAFIKLENHVSHKSKIKFV